MLNRIRFFYTNGEAKSKVEEKKESSPKNYKSIKEYIEEEWLIPYLSIGGTRQEFWKLNPKEIGIDFKAYEMAQKRKGQEKEQEIWLQGLYIKKAIESSVFICALADKKILNSMEKYPKRPHQEEKKYDENDDEEVYISEEEAQMKRQQFMNYFVTFFNRRKGQ